MAQIRNILAEAGVWPTEREAVLRELAVLGVLYHPENHGSAVEARRTEDEVTEETLNAVRPSKQRAYECLCAFIRHSIGNAEYPVDTVT